MNTDSGEKQAVSLDTIFLTEGINMTKYIPVTGLAGVITFALFTFMAFLVAEKMSPTIVDDPTPVITIAQTPDISKAIPRVKPLPEKPPVPQPMKPSVTDVEPTGTNYDFSVDVPRVSTGGIGDDLGPSFTMTDGDARPIVRVDPKYPIDAARDGKEGWVILSFNINKLGEVTNIAIVDAEPKRTFNKAAKQALRKWKYRAKIVDGKPVEQHNLSVQLDFKLDV